MSASAIAGLVLLTTLLPAQSAQNLESLLPMQRILQSSITHVAASVVSVETIGGTEQKPRSGTSSGLVIAKDGWIVVSRYALEFDPGTILVTLSDGRSFPARRAGEDSSRGIALLKIEANDLSVPTFVTPNEVRVGQWAFALGRTFGRDLPSVHMGIVSAKDRIFGRAVQVDANTSPANYGGPVIDLQGRVIGVAVPLSPGGRDAGADWYDSGIGFATTIANISKLINRMKAGEILHRGWLGIRSDPGYLGPGARIDSIAKGSPARGIDLRSGDVILSVDQSNVRNHFHLQILISSHMAGDPIHLIFRRGDMAPASITVLLSELPQEQRKAMTKEEEAFAQPWEKKGR